MTGDRRPTTGGDIAPAPLVAGASCTTCSDAAEPARVLSVDPAAELARVVIGEAPTEVDISLVDGVAPGDLLLVHGGVALERLEGPSDEQPGRF